MENLNFQEFGSDGGRGLERVWGQAARAVCCLSPPPHSFTSWQLIALFIFLDVEPMYFPPN